jgi:O-antigen ligase
MSTAVVLFLVAMLISAAIAPDKITAFKYFFKWTAFVSLYFLSCYYLRNTADIATAIFVIVLTGGVIAVGGVIESFAGYERVWHWLNASWIPPLVMEPDTLKEKLCAFNNFNYFVFDYADKAKTGVRAFGTFECTVAFSAYLGLLIPFSLWLLKTERKHSVFIIPLLGALFLSMTRSALAGLLVAAVAVVVLLKKRIAPVWLSSRRIIIGGAVFAVIVSALLSLNPRMQRILQLRCQPYSHDISRAQLWHNASTIFLASPVTGTGLANYDHGLRKYVGPDAPRVPAHNQYLQIAAETGLLGLVPYLMILLIGLDMSVYVLRTSFDRDTMLLAAGFCCSWIWFIVQSFFSTYLFGDKYSMMFWAMQGMNTALYSIHSQRLAQNSMQSSLQSSSLKV